MRDMKRRKKKTVKLENSLRQIAKKLKIPYGTKKDWREELGFNERIH